MNDLQKQLSKLEQDSFNGQISISDFRKRVQTYAETYHTLQLQQTGVSGRSEQLVSFLKWYVKDEAQRENKELITSIVERYLNETNCH